MSVATMKTPTTPPDRAELVPSYIDTALVVIPDDNPPLNPARITDLEASFREHSQLVPAWICPAPDLPEPKRLCLEGCHRLEVARRLGLPFWAFDLGRFVPEEERIELTFQHNHSRRVMGREEIAERAARYIEITGCTQEAAAKLLNVSPPTLSRAFGDRRILPELRERADRLGLSVRSLIASAPAPLMAQAVAFAETPGADGKTPTRDQVALFIRQLKKSGRPKARRPKTVTLRVAGRAVTFTVGDEDSAAGVADDLKAIAARLGKLADVPPDGWVYHFP